MAYEFRWTIHNYIFSNTGSIQSPNFVTDDLLNTTWFINLISNDDGLTRTLCLTRGRSGKSNRVRVFYEISYVFNERTRLIQDARERFFSVNSCLSGVMLCENLSELADPNITIVLRIWHQNIQDQHFVTQTLTTSIDPDTVSFTWDVSHHYPPCKMNGSPNKILPEVKAGPLLFKLERNFFRTVFELEVCVVGKVLLNCYFRARINLVQDDGTLLGKLDSKNVYLANGIKCCHFFVVKPSTAYIDRSSGSPNSKVYLQLNVETGRDVIHDSKTPCPCEELTYEFVQHVRTRKSKPVASPDAASFMTEVTVLYSEGKQADFTLCTEDRSFPVHKSVLSARSPVFERMFDTEMREKEAQSVTITDVDGEILKKMLNFVYLTSFDEDSECQDVIQLYKAADKYQIDSLKLKCAHFLKTQVSIENVCDLLLLGDLHQDEKLKKFSQKFIMAKPEIFDTEKWSSFIQHSPLLSSLTMRDYICSPSKSRRGVPKERDCGPFDSLAVLFGDLYRRSESCDCTISAEQNMRFYVHKIVLHARTSILEFAPTTQIGDHVEVELPHLDPKTAKQMLDFIYFDKIENFDVESALKLYDTAINYKISSLRKTCQNLLISCTKNDNFIEHLLVAHFHADSDFIAGLEKHAFAGSVESLFKNAKWAKFHSEHPSVAGAVMMNYFRRKVYLPASND